MRVPAKPPRLDSAFQASLQKVVAASDTLDATLARANPTEDYLHWDEFRFRFPDQTREAIKEKWVSAKAERTWRSSTLPLIQIGGEAFKFVELNRFRIALHRIDSRAGTIVTRPEPDLNESSATRYFQRTLIEEPFSSSALEGAATTRAIAIKLIDENRPPKTLDERMVLNNYRAMEFVRQNKTQNLTPDLICELQKIVTDGTLENPKRAGALRTADDLVRVEDTASGEVLHMPPHASELSTRMQALCDFANAPIETAPFVHPVLRAIIVHFMLAYDHPFVDGNGRTARALFYWIALKAGYWLFEYISISSVIRLAPKKYGQAFLYVETDGGDLTYFIDHQLGVVENAIAELHKYLDRKEREANALAAAMKFGLNPRQIQILQDALKRPKAFYTISDHQTLTGVSYLTARKDLEDLAKEGFLVKKREGKSSIFRPVPGLSDNVSVTKPPR
jgi:Fic family protein